MVLQSAVLHRIRIARGQLAEEVLAAVRRAAPGRLAIVAESGTSYSMTISHHAGHAVQRHALG